MYKEFNHIYLIQNDFRDLSKIPILDRDTALTLLISQSVKEIPAEYFSGFTNIRTYLIFAEIHEIGAQCFFQCKNLKEILLPSTLKKIDVEGFSGCGNLAKINLSKAVIEIGKGCFFCHQLILYQ
jgi:hypothetical protein